MLKFFLAGIIWIFLVIAVIIGIKAVDSIHGYNTFAAIGNKRMAILTVAGIMFGSVLLLIGGIMQQLEYNKYLGGNVSGKELLKAQLNYYNELTENIHELDIREKENIERLIKELNAEILNT